MDPETDGTGSKVRDSLSQRLKEMGPQVSLQSGDPRGHQNQVSAGPTECQNLIGFQD